MQGRLVDDGELFSQVGWVHEKRMPTEVGTLSMNRFVASKLRWLQ